MRHLRGVVLTAILSAVFGFASSLAAQSGFEGVIQFKEYGKHNNDHTMVQTTKGSMLRLDNINGGERDEAEPAIIINTKTHTITVLIFERKLYMIAPLENAERRDAMAPRSRPDAKNKVLFTNTGRTETVAGVKCEIYSGTVTNPQGKAGLFEACMAKGVGFAMFEAMGSPGSAGSKTSGADLFRDLAAKDLYILKVWEIEDGTKTPVMEATKIERKSVPGSTFQVPPGFTKMEMPSQKTGARKH